MTVNNNTNISPVVTQANNNQQAANNQNQATQTTNNNVVVPQDVYEPSGAVPTAANSNNNQRYSADISRMREIWTQQERHIESFRRLVETLLNRQVESSNAAGIPWDFNDPNAMVQIDDATRTAAQEAIGEGGPFSVEAVATRLLDFAVAISGGDPSRIDVLRRAVERGFEAAERQWGGELPEISQRTREAVMNGFDQWQRSGNASDITLLNRTTSPAATAQ